MRKSISKWSASVVVLAVAGTVWADKPVAKTPDTSSQLNSAALAIKKRQPEQRLQVNPQAAQVSQKLEHAVKPGPGEKINRLKATSNAPRQLKAGQARVDEARSRKSNIEEALPVRRMLPDEIQAMKLRRID